MKNHVLLVDDDAGLLALGRRFFAAQGWRVTVAEDLETALVQPSPLVLVTDLNLPDGDGLQLICALRQRAPGMPAILTSGDLRHHDLPPGVVFLPKPFSFRALTAQASQFCC